MSISETTVKVDGQYLRGKTKRELEVLVMQLMDMNDMWRIENEQLQAELEDRKSADEEGFEILPALLEENEKLRAFVEDSFCECYDEYGLKRPQTCDRCKLLGIE